MDSNTRHFSQMRDSTYARCWQIIVIAGPFSFALLVNGILEILNTVYAGRMGTIELQGIGLGMTILNIFGFAIQIGFLYGYEVLGPRAFGAQNFSRMGHYFNRARILLFLLSLLLSPIFFFSEYALNSAGIPENVSSRASSFLQIIYPGLILKVQAMQARNHMKAQRVMWPALVIQLIVVCLHIGALQFFVHWANLGYNGIGIAFSFSYATEFIMTYIFLNHTKGIDKRTFVPLTRLDFQEWGEYLKIAVSGVALVTIEWSASQIITLFVNHIGETEFAAQTILANLYVSMNVIAFGYSNSLIAIIGNALGMGDHKLALLFYRDALILAGFVFFLLLSILNLLGPQIISIYTRDQEVVASVLSCLIFLSVQIFFDTLQNILNAVMRGLSLFTLATIVMSLWLWGVYEPLALVLGIYKFRSLRLIYIIQAGTMLGLALSYSFILCKQDWASIAHSVFHKMKVEDFASPLLGYKLQGPEEEEEEVDIKEIEPFQI